MHAVRSWWNHKLSSFLDTLGCIFPSLAIEAIGPQLLVLCGGETAFTRALS